MDPRPVRAELDRILQSSGFAHSERMARFLRCVVERAAGRPRRRSQGIPAGRRSFRPEVRLRSACRPHRARRGAPPAGETRGVLCSQWQRIAGSYRTPEGIAYVPSFRYPGSQASAEHETRERTRSVAVLPILNNSRDTEHDYLCEGITQEIIHALTKATGLRVVAWQSAARFTSNDHDVYAIGRQLGVSYVLRGTLRAASGRLRLLAQLIDTASGEYIWSESYDRRIADVLDIEQDISAGHRAGPADADRGLQATYGESGGL